MQGAVTKFTKNIFYPIGRHGQPWNEEELKAWSTAQGNVKRSYKEEVLDKITLLKENFDAKISKDETKIAEVAKKSENLLKRSYLFTVNFAMNNNEYEAAPYIALTELANANIKFLDTINSGLTEKVKNSLYGKQFQNFIDDIKKSEK